jgi:hypothetical protein
MTIKHLGGIFGRNPEFNDVTIENDLIVDSDTLVVDSANNRVGIRQDTPTQTLHVFDRSSVNSSSDIDIANFMSNTAGLGGTGFKSGIRIQQSGDSDKAVRITSIQESDYSNLISMGFEVSNSGASAPYEAFRVDYSGNILLGGTQIPTSSSGNLVMFNGAAPSASVTNGIVLYAEDVSASSELKVRDEAGNVTTLSPHNFELIPEGPSEDMAWSYYSEKDGKRINVDMLKAIRVLEKMSGEQLVYED